MSAAPAAAHGQLATGLTLGLVVAAGVTYHLLAARRAGEPRGWSRGRTAAFWAGTGVLALAVLPSASPYPPGDLRGHMVQHLLLGMVAPVLLALAAPLTLLLRSVSRPTARRITRVLRATPVQVMTHPVSALLLSLGGLALLLFTPLYSVVQEGGPVHVLYGLHVLAAGYLFAWSTAGPDPAPHRPAVPVRLVVLGVAIAVHAGLSQLLYAGVWVQVEATAAERRGAAEWMYYGGDIAELALAVALVAGRHPRRRAGGPARPSGSDDFRARLRSTPRNADGTPVGP